MAMSGQARSGRDALVSVSAGVAVSSLLEREAELTRASHVFDRRKLGITRRGQLAGALTGLLDADHEQPGAGASIP
jgi:hypothetical protein